MRLASVLALALVAALAIAAVRADTPADCRPDTFPGTWTLYLGPDGQTRDVDCTKPFPVVRKITITLRTPDIVSVGSSTSSDGFYTAIYNQGAEIVFEGKKFFAFSKWEDKGNGTVVSYCDQTMPGFYHESAIAPRSWGCYYAKKNTAIAPRVHRPTLMSRNPGLDAKYVPDHEFVSRINNAGLSWQARHYPEFEGLTIREIDARLGVSRRNVFADQVTNIVRKKVDPAEVAALPKNFDWRNVNGVNYVPPVRNQAKCGSCYIFSSVGMLESRIRILTNNTQQPDLSEQYPLSCGTKYAQGCSGGFEYLIAGKFGQDFGMVEEKCMPYTAQNDKCQLQCSDPRRYYTLHYEFVGGYDGATTEEGMMLEIYKNGPISAGFEVLPDFRSYSSGVYIPSGLTSGNPFTIVNHAIVLVGWGETDDGVKYWIMRNSWGDSWGMSGYCLFGRGHNYAGMESIASMAIPLINHF